MKKPPFWIKFALIGPFAVMLFAALPMVGYHRGSWSQADLQFLLSVFYYSLPVFLCCSVIGWVCDLCDIIGRHIERSKCLQIPTSPFCELCKCSTNLEEYNIIALQPTKITYNTNLGGLVRYQYVGTHTAFACRTCEKYLFYTRWCYSCLVILAVFLGVVVCDNHKLSALYPEFFHPNQGVNPFIIMLFILFITIAAQLTIHGAKLFSRRECMNQKLQEILRPILQRQYGGSAVEIGDELSLKYNVIRLVSPKKFESLKCRNRT